MEQFSHVPLSSQAESKNKTLTRIGHAALECVSSSALR